MAEFADRLLVSAGLSPGQAIDTIARSRGLEVPETDAQRKWIDEFARSLAS